MPVLLVMRLSDSTTPQKTKNMIDDKAFIVYFLGMEVMVGWAL